MALACLASGGMPEASAQEPDHGIHGIGGSTDSRDSRDLRILPIRRVRSMHRTIRAALHQGYRRSPTFRHLLLRLDESDVMVYVVPGFCEVTRLEACLLRHVAISGASRYLRIVINPHKPATELIARLGHELQHALEVAEAPEVVDAASMLALFRRIASGTCRGVPVDCYETAAAVDVEDRVLRELSRGGEAGTRRPPLDTAPIE
jgi:hypothetical protein